LRLVDTSLSTEDTRVDRGEATTTRGDDAGVTTVSVVCWWGERNSLAETWSLSGSNSGTPAIEGLVSGQWWVDGANHSVVAVWVSGAEEPDWAGGLRNLKGVYANCAGGGVVWDEGGCEAGLVGSGVELLGAWVGERRLSYGVVATAELELDAVTNVGLDLVRAEDVGRRTIFSSSNNNSDIDRKGGDDQRSNASEGSGELHFFESLKNLAKRKNVED